MINSDIRFVDAAYIATSGGAHTVSGTFTGGTSQYWGAVGLVLKGG